jgi:hypothetical protein
MSLSDAELDSFIASASAVLGIAIDPSWQDAIRFHLGMSLRMAELVGGFALPDEADPAPVFAA